ncbi:MAG TPA: phosphoribosyltransferase, partial [Aquihabitans sp.]|nr:phosphoribosyltransferase [Aquihabitans sp.]
MPTTAPPALDLVDLLLPFGRARLAAVDAARTGAWLDASLLVAGCTQVVEDHLHRSEGLLDRVAVHLGDGDAGARHAVRAAVGLAATAVRTAHRARPPVAGLVPRRDALLELAIDCAAASATVEAGAGLEPPEASVLADRVERALGGSASWPAELEGRPLRLPSAFRSFDQHPADVRALAGLAAERWPDRQLAIVVVGIRTSGSYLGPIAVAELRRLGYRRAELITTRAGERLDGAQAEAAARGGAGRVLVVDDPPVSGATIQGCIGALAGAGVAPERVALLLALPDGWPVPSTLDALELISLPGAAWHLTQALDPDEVRRSATSLLEGRAEELVGDLVPVPDPVGRRPGGAPRTAREHGRAAFAAEVRDRAGATRSCTLLVQGCGIGLFGRHDADVAARLGDHVPDVLGVHDGLLHQLLHRPDDARSAPEPSDVARYVLDRHRALRVTTDHAAGMRGRKAAWEVAGMLVGGALGRADLALRSTLVHPIVQRLLHVAQPSVIDGRMSADRFLPAGGGRPPVKIDFAEGAFSNRDLWAYDPVADLAAIGDHLGRAPEVLDAWERAGGGTVEPSRWALLRMVAAWDRHRH